MLILNPAVEASTYACFERSTVEQVAISEIEISTLTSLSTSSSQPAAQWWNPVKTDGIKPL
ncbi:hypothetical protein ACLM45_10250 [Synechococcus sp. A10-1-5-9]|uniref:hypothetical protein n=1 Tax=Synechococcus sp. A10-1-5-9 TaxID=3392295 RepID=UPI0039E9B1BC